MFGKMFDKIKKSKETTEDSQSIYKDLVASWNITEMRAYLQNKNADFPMNVEGIDAIVERFAFQEKPSDKFPKGKRLLELNDNDVRVKKAFDVVVLLSSNLLLSLEGVEKLEKFRMLHEDVIEQFDKRNAQTYNHKLKDAIAQAIVMVEAKKGLEKRLDVSLNGAKTSTRT